HAQGPGFEGGGVVIDEQYGFHLAGGFDDRPDDWRVAESDSAKQSLVARNFYCAYLQYGCPRRSCVACALPVTPRF
ncbi:hypothetical protein, partial [Caballeronia sp.]|uniref:hypothetical protein n=1 Tax=Caballeronia sp. TaxID=1931223 RepID=UPI00262EC7AA